MTPHPMRIIPWDTDFIDALADLLAREHAGHLADCRIVFPHHRPARYLMARLAAHPKFTKPLLAPRCQTFGELVADLRRQTVPVPLAVAGPLDRAALLHQIVRQLRETDANLLAGLELKTERFLPWGLRLANLLDECMRHGLAPRELALDEEEALPEARALLGQIETIYEAYVAALAREKLTTEGNDCRLVLEQLERVPALLASEHVILAGFYALSGAEDALFRTLWEANGADVLWHSDPALADGQGHWAAGEHLAWARRWGATLCVESGHPTKTGPRLRFVEAYDRHSELLALSRELASLPDDQGAAVVLPDEALLPPVLHHLPARECNISMGYPLERASLAQLVENVLLLAENTEAGRCRGRDLSALIRHPYLKMLVLPGEGEERPLRAVFRQWEKTLRASGGRVDPLDFVPDYAELDLAGQAHASETLRAKVVERCVHAFARAGTLAGLAGALRGLIALLVEHGGEMWRDHLLDAECLCRLRAAILPALCASRLAHEPLARSTLHAVLRELVRLERVPFEPDPITGLQVVGVLETRLLRFSRLFVLEATEDRLPGGAASDPLLPDSLRGRLGLPDTGARDAVAAYNFFRLLAGAQEAVLFYRQGDAPGLLDATPARSRFVEMLLWEEEQRRGRLIKAGEEPVERVVLPLSALRVQAAPVEKTGAMRQALLDYVETRGLSPSSLDAYMKCPKAFFLHKICGLRPPEEVGEAGDPAALGTVIHGLLHEFLEPHLGRETTLSALDADDLCDRFSLALRAEPFFTAMPFDARILLDRTGRERLRRFLSHQPRTTVLALEQPVELRVPFADREVRIHGYVDRIDLRDGERLVIDYKTGRVQKAKRGLWSDAGLWEALERWRPDAGPEADPLQRLAELVGSTQMPLYMLLCGDGETPPPAASAWVELANEGEEIPFFPGRMAREERAAFVSDQTPRLLAFLLRHMAEAPVFAPVPGERCRFCDVRGPCGA